MTPFQIFLVIAAVLALGIIILPLINRRQFKRMPYDQQVLAIMKQANKLVYFKHVSGGRKGNLFFVKNKRKILVYPWVLDDEGRMVIVKDNPFDNWDYPENRPSLNEDEVRQARDELCKYSEKSFVKILFNDPFKEDVAQDEPQD